MAPGINLFFENDNALLNAAMQLEEDVFGCPSPTRTENMGIKAP